MQRIIRHTHYSSSKSYLALHVKINKLETKGLIIMEDNNNVENKEVEIKVEVVKPEEVKTDTVPEDKVEVKKEVKVEDKKDTSEYDAIVEKVRVLEESNKQQSDLLNIEMIKNTIMEKVSDKELQKTIMETGLVKNIEDIDMVIKIVEMSKTLNKSVSHKDGFIPQDEVTVDAYAKAEQKGDILSMIKHKMSKK
ncbi:hypothetical protein [Clostridium estertheticum]|uniref:hypothetical protein n=1 Tax=Clostridium estertheticum TaxID=238834 RepID=UPI00124BD1E7|nr:hypothetical protein [Clostridium estertheticum]MBZ9616790.1 hypothetical protein [Clostridium estertheticum subsp. laramiense]WAG72497.1 hypothetical protein LL032_15230 [Clostridium estertheticum]